MTGDRIACINPRCRRTAPADKYEAGTEIICGKCFRALPASIRTRDRSLNRKRRTMLRYVQKPERAAAAERALTLIEDALHRNWGAMHAFFRPGERPEGIDAFLEEVGL